MDEIDNEKKSVSRAESHTPKPKKPIKIIITISVLSLIILGLSGFVVYDKFFAPKHKCEAKEDKCEVTKETENLNVIADALLQKINYYRLDQLDLFEKNATYTDTLNMEQIATMHVYFGYLLGSKFTKKGVDEYVKNVYGLELKEYPDIKCVIDNIPFYKYDAKKGIYVDGPEHPGHGGMLVVQSAAQKIYSIKKENDNYILTLNKLYIENDGMDTVAGVYLNAVQKNVRKEFNEFIYEGMVWEAGAISYYNNNYEKYKESKPKYQYTFKKDKEGNFYLIKYEVIK